MMINDGFTDVKQHRQEVCRAIIIMVLRLVPSFLLPRFSSTTRVSTRLLVNMTSWIMVQSCHTTSSVIDYYCITLYSIIQDLLHSPRLSLSLPL